MRSFQALLLILTLGIAACSSTKPTASANRPDSTVTERPLVFSFFISGSGGGSKAQDSWTLDTAGMMAVHTLTPTAPGKWNTVNAMAELDPPDRDSLVHFIRTGRLWTVDSTDIDQQCAGDELFAMIIAVLGEPHQLHATFHSCAQDYNLLLEPQRTEFKRLMEWWERMRVKYRPIQP
jgi:hypothetical protein